MSVQNNVYVSVMLPWTITASCSSSTQTNLTWVTGPNPSTVLGPQTSEVQTDESIPINTPNSAKQKPSTSQIRSNILKNVARVTSSSQPNKDVHKNKKDENPPKHTKLDKPKPAKPTKPKITTDRQQKGSQNPLADYNSYNVLEHLGLKYKRWTLMKFHLKINQRAQPENNKLEL